MFFVTCVKEAYTKLADLCHKRGWHLFYIRPKLHMVSEEGFLGYDACIYISYKNSVYICTWDLRLKLQMAHDQNRCEVNPLSGILRLILAVFSMF